jgi:hypothetical protein
MVKKTFQFFFIKLFNNFGKKDFFSNCELFISNINRNLNCIFSNFNKIFPIFDIFYKKFGLFRLKKQKQAKSKQLITCKFLSNFILSVNGLCWLRME